jgi:hypothetical protein|tara:strand:- start:411 stop:947 length:537 start_codon:yes stop_codon:yes gene_type:complete
MKFQLPYLVVVMATILFTISIMDDENTILDLENQLQQQNNIIDSLKSKIDTLQWQVEIWDYNVVNNTTHILSAIIHVESSNNDSAYHKGEDAVGCLQIRQCMVDDVNRILKRQKSTKRYLYHDRWLRYKSIEMFDVYCKHYGLTTAEEIARCWNGGPRGMQNEMTAGYWEKVKNKIDG